MRKRESASLVSAQLARRFCRIYIVCSVVYTIKVMTLEWEEDFVEDRRRSIVLVWRALEKQCERHIKVSVPRLLV
jgi:hypothetical protein